MTKYAILTTTILMTILCASLLGTASAQTYTPGVKVGDVFKYQYEFSTEVNGTSQISLSTPFDALAEQAKTIDWIQMTVTSVSGSIITAQTLTQYKTGTQQSFTGTVNVASGVGLLAKPMFFTAANLSVSSPLYEGSNEKINGTITKTYASGVTRELTYENLTSEEIVQPSELVRYNITVPLTQVNTQEYFWDKQTGALTEMNLRMDSTSTQLNATFAVSLKLVESNVFAVPEYPAIGVVLLVMVIPTFVVLKKRKKLIF